MELEIASGSLILHPELANELRALHESSGFKTAAAFLKHLFALEEQNRSEQCLTSLFGNVNQPWIGNYNPNQAVNPDSVQPPGTASVGVQVKLCCQSQAEIEMMTSHQQSAISEVNSVQQEEFEEETTCDLDDDVDQSDSYYSEAEERTEAPVVKHQTPRKRVKKTPAYQVVDKPMNNRRKRCQGSIHGYTCEECGTKFNREAHYVHHMKKHRGEETAQQCQYCPLTYPSPWTLRLHVSNMHPEHAPPPRDKAPLEPLLCHICGVKMKTLFTFRQHQRRHTDERPYKCSQCPRTFRYSSALVYHRRTHTKERSYPCPLCDRVFRYSSGVIRHQVVHTGAKRHMCHHCNSTFTEASSLREHILKQHEQPGLKPYECPHCQKRYSRKFSMNCHIKKKHLNPNAKKSNRQRSRWSRKKPVHVSMTGVVSHGFKSKAETTCTPKLSVLPEVSKSPNPKTSDSNSISTSSVNSVPNILLTKRQTRTMNDIAHGKSEHRQAEIELAEVMAEMLSS